MSPAAVLLLGMLAFKKIFVAVIYYVYLLVFRLSVLKPARKRGGAKREGVLVDCIDDGRVYSTDDTRKKVNLTKI